MNLKAFSIPEKTVLLERLSRLALSRNVPQMTAHNWLKGVPIREYNWFWKPLILSLMNCLPEEADIVVLRTALSQGFLREGGLGFFTQPQGEIFHRRALEALLNAGVEVKFRHRVKEVGIAGRNVFSLKGDFPGEIKGEQFIFAMPPDALLKIFAEKLYLLGMQEEALNFQYSDICNVHLVFEREIFPNDFGCLLEMLPQWFFRKRWMDAGEEGVAYSLVISAADTFIPQGTSIVDKCLEYLRRCGANLDNNRLLYHKLVWMRKATVKLTPESASNRPGSSTALENVYLAGDWTATGLPASIESAVQSGEKAVDRMMNSE